MSHEKIGHSNPPPPKTSGTEAQTQRTNRRRNRGNVTPADWNDANPVKIAQAVAAVSQHGYAIRFGYTKDTGAFAIGIIGDGEPFTEFVRPTEDIDLFLDGIREDYNAGIQ